MLLACRTLQEDTVRSLLQGIDQVLLMGPGPSTVPEPVYQALRLPTLGYLDPYFVRILDEIKASLQSLLNTRNRLTFPMSATGMGGMETCLVNLVGKGDRVLVITNGVFSKRMQDVATRLGAEVDLLEFEWGTAVDPRRVASHLESRSYAVVAMVHGETSTGVRNPAAEVGEVVRRSKSRTGALYLLDAVTTLGGLRVAADEWGVDALYSGSQKCIACPPGLSPVTFSDRALERARGRKPAIPSFYMDLPLLLQYWEGEKRVYHHTVPVNMLYAFDKALQLILDEGPDNVFARHQAAFERLVQGLESLGLELLVAPAARLASLTAVKVPAGVDEAGIRKRLREEFRIEIGAGLGPLAGKIWRIGLMGHTARPENVDRLLGAFKTLLGR
jgi:alanine-glyoxylate transaminase / serine-glyoxylate transaminase / serine-pyruvate transaminase